MILISAIGFEEKFLVRCFLRNGKNNIDKVILIKPEGEENPKTREAINNFKKLLDEASIPLEILEVNQLDLISTIVKISKKILSIKKRDFLLNLSSGMRILNFEILATFLMLGYDAKVEIEAENLTGVVTFELKEIVNDELDEKEVEIINAIKGGHKKVRDIAKVTNIPLSTVSKKINNLAEKGYLEKGKEIKLTKKGEIISQVY
ncbi:CRISPR locus-related DNA-binding protein [Sulfolobus sp. A20-N-F6]|uniref:CRISPR-associated CARF protein Csa3 n=1 Tax=Sulfolobaceae TaxID=118883 RepID=UPI0009F51219|nr:MULTISPECIES: CRISPR-associated CARF protein Csa3 [unclassified Sulfolobus]TRM75095.1 CRISPR locus-related DNA-binding protein [Sulfolobus sp. A20-N-F8]TRM79627.1 CRISPR locus-related DNA-binding protein [Sulfolobus sp. B5]TRM80624.1 CRISPR locus-related DNA-binding protein [Sulfolobus sp. D5]TRM83392.1 CRISPR locus-related DNA-binding protein [Sulfolobus sp. A20-N-F6]TRM89368.1 CRISPR locus-related DNA-binding protein [Sulfolobus sp. C3]TRM98372.1 CRISPR locus-related DNA-binding protein 